MQKRIIVSILLSVLIILVSLGLVSYYQLRSSIERSYQDRLSEARIIATAIDHILEENLTRLYDISLSDQVDLQDGSWEPERKVLRAAYEYSIFTDGVFLLDKLGNVMLTYPPRDGWEINLLGIPPVSRVITDMKPVISNVYAMGPGRQKIVFTLVPLKDRHGEVVGAAGGLLDPTSYTFTRMFQSIPSEKNMNIELVDSLGIVIASNNPSSILSGIDHNKFLSTLIAGRQTAVAACHRCHEGEPGDHGKTADILAFAPLSIAPWGVALRMPQSIVFLPSDRLRDGFILLGVISLITSLVLALGMSKSILRPVQQLIQASGRIAGGNLTSPVEVEGSGEIQTLARSFDNMRLRLAASLDSVQRYNAELGERVRKRTQQLVEKQVAVASLLKKLITSQEDERKRIARELHDESLQTLSALLMNIEMCRLHPHMATPEKIASMKEIVTRVINEMNKVIQNLRPTVLDDLGFEEAIIWLLDRNLRDRKINCHPDMHDLMEERLSPELQTTLFRIIQEITTNIARHANAENVFLSVSTDRTTFRLIVEDDGMGFDTGLALADLQTGRGLGIIGMKERASQINGSLHICSTPGMGTMVLCRVPLTQEE